MNTDSRFITLHTQGALQLLGQASFCNISLPYDKTSSNCSTNHSSLRHVRLCHHFPYFKVKTIHFCRFEVQTICCNCLQTFLVVQFPKKSIVLNSVSSRSSFTNSQYLTVQTHSRPHENAVFKLLPFLRN